MWIISWMLITACRLVVELRWSGLDFVSGRLVVMRTYLYYFSLLLSLFNWSINAIVTIRSSTYDAKQVCTPIGCGPQCEAFFCRIRRISFSNAIRQELVEFRHKSVTPEAPHRSDVLLMLMATTPRQIEQASAVTRLRMYVCITPKFFNPNQVLWLHEKLDIVVLS